MLDRRTFCLGISSGLAFNGQPLFADNHAPQSTVAKFGIVDVHTHIFNGLDVPVVGFILNAFLRKQDEDLIGDGIQNSLLKLVHWLVFNNSKSAGEELENFGNRDNPYSLESSIEADKTRLFPRLLHFIAGKVPQLEEYPSTREQDLNLLAQLAVDIEYKEFDLNNVNPERDAAEFLKGIYQLGPLGGFVQLYKFATKIVEAIRWAGLKTRDRFDILGEMVRLYGGEGRVRIFTPSIVDLDMWFKTGEQSSDIRSQINLYREMAQRTDQALILPFAPFCPLRAALEHEDGKTTSFDNLQYAIEECGFFGVKLYPTMGFSPINNGDDFRHAARAPIGGGSAIDDELIKLYKFCKFYDIPIKAHANNSLAAGHNTGPLAHPSKWAELLAMQDYRNLRVNLAHFGGFEESHGIWKKNGTCDPFSGDWEHTIAQKIYNHQGMYFDLGYWMELADSKRRYHSCSKQKAQHLFAKYPRLYERALYGSDWSMIGKEPGHRTYLEDIGTALGGPGFEASAWAYIMGLNALRFLSLDRPGQQHERLMQFHSNHPVVQEMFI